MSTSGSEPGAAGSPAAPAHSAQPADGGNGPGHAGAAPSTESAAPTVEGLYFDGRSARAQPVVLTLQGDTLAVHGAVGRSEPLARLRLSEPMGNAPRLITFDDGAHVEVRDHAAFARLLHLSGQRDRAAVRWARTPRTVAIALLALILLGWFGWHDSLPWAARQAAPLVPAATVTLLSQQALQTLEADLLAPSELEAARQQRLEQALQDFAHVDGRPIAHRLLFRSAPKIGANAFALPDGTLIVTDALVELAADDDEVLAVLAHELGHVHERHGLRLLLQSSAVALVTSWYLGDFSGWLATGPTLLAQAAYSRDMEFAADDFAARLLRAQGRSSEPLVSMLEKLQNAPRRKAADSKLWLRSHPQTAERVERLRAGG
ncbi:MAG: M48 family metallopeptidase [Burkholderiales bacterium]|nr:M48 family metallopeptidase [Burkholderiales bacterium]